MTSTTDVFVLARQRHQAGDLERAEHLYRQVLQADPCHAESWHGLGVLASHRGRPDHALELIAKALALRPDAAPYHLNRGVACRTLGRLEEALASFRRAADLQPDLAEAHNNLANALYEGGQKERAVEHWHRALQLRNDYADAYSNLGRALLQQGRGEEAVAHLRRALDLQPHSAQAHVHLGDAWVIQKQWEAAAACFREALRHDPQDAQAHCHLGHVLQKQGKLPEAVASLREAVRLQADLADAHNELGAALGALGQPEEAFRHLHQALWLQPDHPEANHNLGVLLKGQRRWDEAVARFRQALRLRPDLTDAYLSLAHTFCRQGRPEEAAACLREALARQPDHAPVHATLGESLADQGHLAAAVASFREAMRLQPDLATAHSSLVMALNFDPQANPDDLLAEHRRWAEVHARVAPLGPDPGYDRDPARRLRVGYVSADLHQHVLAHFVEPLLAHHDPRQVETVCYADVPAPDAVTNRLRSLAHRWYSIRGQGDAEVAQLIRADRIDLLVDLGGHTGTRLGVFARQPAPVQITYLGYPNTTGLGTVHYRLTDAVADPPGEPTGHTETLVRLPGGFCCYQPSRDAPAVAPPPHRTAGQVTFGSLHKLVKLNADVLDLWCAVLRAVPDSRLLVFRDALRGETREYFRQEFERRGIPEGRVLLRHAVEGGGSYLGVYRDIDVLLDAFPWSGHATACEALWMGVPVLTLYGNRHAGRMVASVLTQVGLPDLIAHTPEEYITAAARLAGDRDRLASLRAHLRERMLGSPLCNSRAFTRHLEEAYREMWRRWAEMAEPAKSEPTSAENGKAPSPDQG
jgi:predicted O-linked N-acetylglucosamine transferase (SPINDLY family)